MTPAAGPNPPPHAPAAPGASASRAGGSSLSRRLLRHPLSHGAAIVLLGALAYANSLGVPFVFDDLESIVQNEVIRDLRNYLPGGSGYDFLFRRWISYFTFALNYRLGGLDVAGYHLFNLAVHLGSALLVYALVRQLFRTPHLSGGRLSARAGAAALLAALFFVAHPVQTQAVTYVVQRLASLCALFYLSAVVLYGEARLRLERHWHGETRRGGALLLLGASFASALLAMHTKEIAFTLPFAALLVEASFFRGPWRRRALALLPLFVTLVSIPVSIFLVERFSGESLQELAQTQNLPRDYLLTQFRVLVTYLRLLALPVGQHVDYHYPLYTSFLAPPVLLSFLFLSALVALTLCVFWRSRPADAVGPSADSGSVGEAPEWRLISFGVLWFFLTLAVESSFVPIEDAIFEHRLYLPSVGPAAALGVAVLLASRRTAAWFGGRLPLITAAAAIAALTAATWQRNAVWQTEIGLWEEAARRSPGKARNWYNLGTYLTDADRVEEAVAALTRAVEIDPEYADAWHNLGRAYLVLNRSSDAVPPLQTAVRLNPQLDNAILNLAVALTHSRRFDETVALLERHRRRAPDWPELYLQLGIAYAGAGDLAAARHQLATLRRLGPHLALPLANLLRQSAGSPSMD
ncbi:MAG: tetratricopeptide repeat protein [Deferrisomatales bacterium]